MSELCSIKSLVYASMIARAFNCVAGNIVHFKYFLNKNFHNNNNNNCVEHSLVVSVSVS